MNPTNNDEIGVALHDAAIHGYKRKLKKIVAKGIDVDYPNAAGQTALFCACFEGQESVIGVLLQHGANPNQ
ncbi:hypothetical protein LSAT2_018455 [Lamellibrachia satsuma]|nr:hypothetical protein LSAT2_018455 [Lamellibrachia satsuma]